jgi:alkylhydroperoxidase family enzyme
MPKPARRRSADEDLADIGRYRQSARFSEVEKLALDLAVAMTSTPAEVSDALRDELRRHLTDGQLAELAASIAWESHRARLNRGLGVRAPGFSEGSYCVVPEHP